MAGPQQTRQLGHICRIYKNSSDKVIAIDDISINVTMLRVEADKFHVAVQDVDVGRTLVHLGEGNRIVDKILMFGNYSSIQEDSGNYFDAFWNAPSSNQNDVNISLRPYVSALGDTI